MGEEKQETKNDVSVTPCIIEFTRNWHLYVNFYLIFLVSSLFLHIKYIIEPLGTILYEISIKSIYF